MTALPENSDSLQIGDFCLLSRSAPSDTPETDQLLECDQYKVDDDGAEYSAYRRMAEHAQQMERCARSHCELEASLRSRIAQLEDELAKACNKVEELVEIGLDQMDKERSLISKLSDYRSQRDRLAEALRMITTFDYSDLQCDNGHGCKFVAIEALQSITPNVTP